MLEEPVGHGPGERKPQLLVDRRGDLLVGGRRLRRERLVADRVDALRTLAVELHAGDESRDAVDDELREDEQPGIDVEPPDQRKHTSLCSQTLDYNRG